MADSDPHARAAGVTGGGPLALPATREGGPGVVPSLTRRVPRWWRPGSTRANLLLAAQCLDQADPLPRTALDDRAADPARSELSRRVLDVTGLAGHESSTLLAEAAERTLLDLGAHLATLIGADGYRTLLTRALQMTAADYPFLAAVQAMADPPGRLVGLPAGPRPVAPWQVHLALTATLTTLLEVLRRFIGEDLTVRLLADVWPQLAAATASQDTVPPRRRRTSA